MITNNSRLINSSTHDSPHQKIEPAQRLKRSAVRLFFGLFLSALVVDALPDELPGAGQAKWFVGPFLNRTGLWQGQWTLFAPNPKINNAWISAEVYAPDGSQSAFWNSTYWAETSTWERFSGFRHINYNNRIQTQGKRAADDLADFLARALIPPSANSSAAPQDTWRLVLSRTELNVVLPDDGSLPSRDETLWISSSQNLTVKEYQP